MTRAIDNFLEQAVGADGLQADIIVAGLQAANRKIFDDFDLGVDAETLVHAKAEVVDRVLQTCFEYFLGDQSGDSCLVAVGGYGRAELLPGSDIDLMILLQRKPNKAQQRQISTFLTIF